MGLTTKGEFFSGGKNFIGEFPKRLLYHWEGGGGTTWKLTGKSGVHWLGKKIFKLNNLVNFGGY